MTAGTDDQIDIGDCKATEVFCLWVRHSWGVQMLPGSGQQFHDSRETCFPGKEQWYSKAGQILKEALGGFRDTKNPKSSSVGGKCDKDETKRG